MKHTLIIALFAVACTAMAADPATTSQLGPIAFLAGGVWHGTLPPTPDGSKMGIDLKADWTGNHQGIRFDGNFVINGKPAPYSSGLYAWHPGKKQVVFMYSDAEGNLAEGVVKSEGNTLVHEFGISHTDGTIERVRAVITPHGTDAYTNDIFVEKNGSMEKKVSVEYHRAAA